MGFVKGSQPLSMGWFHSMPLQIIVAFTMLYMEVQYAFLAGLGVLILLIPCECHTISLITHLYSSTHILNTIILVKDMTITLFRTKTMFCGIDGILWNISHIQRE